ncbi:uncharacterized protein LOC120849529 [Ixodes scapularis]|uniref:uncharacterized protein LOC120849529 n=1 Tax=Ixodes scapularis TaxID=6945 RepID=UPI001A9F80FB|nr:uncharacterized protein LOC120849529 [Ixodes scapularis]
MAAMAAVSSSVSPSKAPVLPSPARFQTTFAKTSFLKEARQVVLNVYYKLRCGNNSFSRVLMARRWYLRPSEKEREVAQQNDKFPKISRTTLWRALVDLGFTFVKRNRDSLLMERTDLVLWRATYLRAIRKHRLHDKTIYYLDETWVNAGHTRSKVWKDTTVKTPRDAFNKGLTVGLKNPSGKGERLIVVHAGSSEGFVDGAAEVFRAKTGSGDYHEEMDGARFEECFTEKLLPNLKPNSVIFMDNASYHAVRLHTLPSSRTRKEAIQ